MAYTKGMKYFEVAPIKIVRAGSAVFTYESDLGLQAGQLVLIPVGKNVLHGVVIKEVAKPSYATKPVNSVIEDTALPDHIVKIAVWISDYYRTPLATVLQTILPRGLTTKRRVTKSEARLATRHRTNIVLNDDQRRAIEGIFARESGTSIVQGVTGSGKTEVYKEIARRTIASGRSVILLVPEIGLTEQIIDELTQDFPDALITHSQMTEAQRHTVWRNALTSTAPRLIIGPRSALFLPIHDLGAVIIDEAHEPSYKQEQSPRYSALRVASMYGVFCKARVIFGSATPLITDRFTAETNNVPIVRLDSRARKSVTPTKTTLVDMTKKDNLSSQRFLSKKLITEIEQTLAKNEQSLIFHNRRGSASTTLCESCGWTALCPRCFVPMILHEDSFKLSCHICSISQKAPTSCPECGSASIIHKGVGTKRIVSELQRLFPRATIARFDSDNTAQETLQARYKELYDGDVDIIVGTQVVAKGLDLPRLRTVGVIQADSGLALPDYSANERTFQLLAQVIGRVGRDHRETNVIIQTYQPTHPVIQCGISQDYESFYAESLKERAKAKFPPYRYILQLTTVYKTEAGAIRAARTLASNLQKIIPSRVEILGPTPAFYERQHGTYRWQLIIKSPQRKDLTALLEHIPTTHWQAELDPTSLI